MDRWCLLMLWICWFACRLNVDPFLWHYKIRVIQCQIPALLMLLPACMLTTSFLYEKFNTLTNRFSYFTIRNNITWIYTFASRPAIPPALHSYLATPVFNLQIWRRMRNLFVIMIFPKQMNVETFVTPPLNVFLRAEMKRRSKRTGRRWRRSRRQERRSRRGHREERGSCCR